MPVEPIQLPIHCPRCEAPVTIEYDISPDWGGRQSPESPYPCPHCHQDMDISVPGRLLDAWAGHGRNPDRDGA
jgi:hypothetical protein